MVIMLIGSAVFILSYSTLSIFIDFKHKILVAFYSLGIGVQYFYNYVARALQKNTLFVMSGCINSIITIIINVVLIAGFNLGIESLYISSLVGILVQVVIIEYNVRLLKVKIEGLKKGTIIALLKFSTPLSISTISNWLLSGLTTVVISFYIGTHENGLYSVANRFSAVLILLVGVFQFAWNELAYMMSNNKSKNEYYQKGISEILKISLLGCSIFLLCIKIVFPYFIAQQYHEAITIIPIVLLGTSINAYSGFLGTIFLANKHSNKLFISTIVGAAANVIGLLVFSPIYGLMGALISLCVAQFISAFSRLYMLKKSESIRPHPKVYIFLLVPLISLVTFYLISNTYILLTAVFAFLVIAFFTTKPFLIGVLDIFKKRFVKSN